MTNPRFNRRRSKWEYLKSKRFNKKCTIYNENDDWSGCNYKDSDRDKWNKETTNTIQPESINGHVKTYLNQNVLNKQFNKELYLRLCRKTSRQCYNFQLSTDTCGELINLNVKQNNDNNLINPNINIDTQYTLSRIERLKLEHIIKSDTKYYPCIQLTNEQINNNENE